MKIVYTMLLCLGLSLQAQTITVSSQAEFDAALVTSKTNAQEDTIFLKDGSYSWQMTTIETFDKSLKIVGESKNVHLTTTYNYNYASSSTPTYYPGLINSFEEDNQLLILFFSQIKNLYTRTLLL